MSGGVTVVPNSLPCVHGHGERYQLRLGSEGFYVVDTGAPTEDGKHVPLVSDAQSQKFRGREICDRLNTEEK